MKKEYIKIGEFLLGAFALILLYLLCEKFNGKSFPQRILIIFIITSILDLFFKKNIFNRIFYLLLLFFVIIAYFYQNSFFYNFICD